MCTTNILLVCFSIWNFEKVEDDAFEKVENDAFLPSSVYLVCLKADVSHRVVQVNNVYH